MRRIEKIKAWIIPAGLVLIGIYPWWNASEAVCAAICLKQCNPGVAITIDHDLHIDVELEE